MTESCFRFVFWAGGPSAGIDVLAPKTITLPGNLFSANLEWSLEKKSFARRRRTICTCASTAELLLHDVVAQASLNTETQRLHNP